MQYIILFGASAAIFYIVGTNRSPWLVLPFALIALGVSRSI